MSRMRVALIAEMRSSTPADPKGNRKMLHGALSLLAPDSSLRRKLARCGKWDPANDSRWFCRRPSCGVCMSTSQVAVQDTPVAIAANHANHAASVDHHPDPPVSSDLDYGAAEMQRQHRRLQRILTKFDIGNGKDRAHHLRVWGARGVECADGGWQFHVHMLADLGGANVHALAKILRSIWSGPRGVQIKAIEQRDHMPT
jgi:hypothetical protein